MLLYSREFRFRAAPSRAVKEADYEGWEEQKECGSNSRSRLVGMNTLHVV
jgi:hypothetical protein